MNFENWKKTIFSLDRYENSNDAKKFEILILEKPVDASEKQYINCLLKTFSNQDDYGIQEKVLASLDNVNQRTFYEVLGEGFQELLKNTDEQEWGLLILGRIINSGNKSNIKELAASARKCTDKSMLNFLKSEEFQDEYPEIAEFL